MDWRGQERLTEEDQREVKERARWLPGWGIGGGEHPLQVQQAERTELFKEQQGGGAGGAGGCE